MVFLALVGPCGCACLGQCSVCEEGTCRGCTRIQCWAALGIPPEECPELDLIDAFCCESCRVSNYLACLPMTQGSRTIAWYRLWSTRQVCSQEFPGCPSPRSCIAWWCLQPTSGSNLAYSYSSLWECRSSSICSPSWSRDRHPEPLTSVAFSRACLRIAISQATCYWRCCLWRTQRFQQSWRFCLELDSLICPSTSGTPHIFNRALDLA